MPYEHHDYGGDLAELRDTEEIENNVENNNNNNNNNNIINNNNNNNIDGTTRELGIIYDSKNRNLGKSVI